MHIRDRAYAETVITRSMFGLPSDCDASDATDETFEQLIEEIGFGKCFHEWALVQPGSAKAILAKHGLTSMQDAAVIRLAEIQVAHHERDIARRHPDPHPAFRDWRRRAGFEA